MEHILSILPKNPVALAPMDGYTDMPFRMICRELGSAFSFTEFVAADAVCRKIEKTHKILQYDEVERPVIFQIFGHDVDTIVEAARLVEEKKPDAIDINMGCSVKKICQRGAGVGLMHEPQKVIKLFSALKKIIKVPVSGKIRLGWSDSEKNYIEIGKILEGEGAWAVFIHARTRTMGYKGNASWEEISLLKENVQIPVFGNGDVLDLADARNKIYQYGVDGVLIGRKAMGNPWVFSDKKLNEISYLERVGVILRHLDLNVAYHGESQGVLLFRKQITRYLKGIASSSAIKQKLITETKAEKIHEILNNFQPESIPVLI
ncbi:MAG: tRNA dihydrouridine synthase DusB [Spirochaetia bacterium]|nr:tRNA dihydrouridine synthase DusB [Spirochaetia bacterium]